MPITNELGILDRTLVMKRLDEIFDIDTSSASRITTMKLSVRDLIDDVAGTIFKAAGV